MQHLWGYPSGSKKAQSMNLGLLQGLPKALSLIPYVPVQLKHPWVLSPAVPPGTRCIPPNPGRNLPGTLMGPPLWGQSCPPPQQGGQQGYSLQHQSSGETNRWGWGKGI